MKAITTLAWLAHLTYLIEKRLINGLPRLYVYSKGESERREREQHFLVVSPGLSHSELATQTGNLCELCLSVNHFDCCCCCWWHAHAANHSTQSSVAQRSAAQAPTHQHPQLLPPQPRAPYYPQPSLQRGLPQLIFTLSACSFGHINQIQHFSYACAQTNKQTAHSVHIEIPIYVLFIL